MLVVADSSALIALVACGALEVLGRLFAEVRVPPAVFAEVTVEGRFGAEPLRAYLAGKVTPVEPADLVIRAAGLGRGELEAMALYRRARADRLLVDDGRARRVAVANGLRVVGSAGVLVQAKQQRLVPEVRPLLDAIEAAGTHVGPRLRAEALRLAGEG